jgi:hypothetical protein
MLTCRDKGVEPPPPRMPTIMLAADSIGITEVRLRVRFTGVTVQRAFTLRRDGQTLLTVHSSPLDTTVTDTTLLRGRTYLYQAYRLQNSVVVDSSDAVVVKTIDSASITISYAEALVTEVELQITINDRNPMRRFQLVRDGQPVFTAQCSQRDTLIIDDGLLPCHTYAYKVYRLAGNVPIDSSTPQLQRTLDTTSHNFTWQIDTLGDGNGSMLRDVAIIDENNVWAVGEISVKDTNGNFINPPFNYAIWNGSYWKLQTSFEQGYLYGTLYAVFAFTPNDIWVGSTIPEHWDGVKWTFYGTARGFPTSFYIKKIWGASSSNLYVVGTGGSIVHYDGMHWQKMESGTDVDLTDVWGTPGGSIVWACGWNQDRPGTILLRNYGNGWETAYDGTQSAYSYRLDSLSGVYSSIYSVSLGHVYVCSYAGMYLAPASTHGEAKRLSFTSGAFPGFPHSMRGCGANDLFIVGEYYFMAHYNGMTWQNYTELVNIDGRLRAVAQCDNLVVAVGVSYDPFNSKGIVIRGRR